MIIRYFPFILLLLYINGYGNSTSNGTLSNPAESVEKDSIGKQILFNGRLWKNQFASIEGHQYLFTPYSITGAVTIDNRMFKNVLLRYDIANDELLIQKDAYRIIRTNPEFISSFDIFYNDEHLHFVNLDNIPTEKLKGYYHLFYDSDIKIYVRYSKEIQSPSMTNGLPKFIQHTAVYILKNGEYFKVKNLRNLLSILGNEEEQKLIKKFIRIGNIKVTIKDPSSIKRVVEYYEKIVSQ